MKIKKTGGSSFHRNVCILLEDLSEVTEKDASLVEPYQWLTCGIFKS
jgi:hypothetical protein